MTTVSHPVFARLWPRLAAAGERQGTSELRDRLLAPASGRVLEVGAGSGTNFGHYPPSVSEVVAVEPEPRLRALAAAAASPVLVRVVDGEASALPAGDGEFDVVVASLVLCSVPAQARALAEVRRVLRPGGRLLFWEHVRGDGGLARTQRVLDATVWPFLAGGCHTGRDTLAAIEAAGFTIERLERFDFPELAVNLNPTRPQVLGTAVRG
ncbi:class I SAM-dependent methyltransferase [Blastococcus sp. TF02A-26]|uniref:class I SAM-dependent methyltransferase n=1 Tax=Blastococcus sp. TF02A-26 TaxID=2250577 RepID=UPI000DEA8227|nr:class I SAM-dependent methyltransferase [Blastococcus sp. TF02A-26]RBY83189.1 SAM-dependent methyltransferase [Blastococcus sp. TF02A-26]